MLTLSRDNRDDISQILLLPPLAWMASATISVFKGGNTMGSLAERFWTKVQRSADPDACWLWQGSRLPSGYGMLAGADKPRKNLRASRVSWILHYGSIPDKLWVLHHCDNPPCVRPNHLFLGTCKDNVWDSLIKGRRASRKGTANGRAILNNSQVQAIRQAYHPHYGALTALAREYGVALSTVRSIVIGRNWPE